MLAFRKSRGVSERFFFSSYTPFERSHSLTSFKHDSTKCLIINNHLTIQSGEWRVSSNNEGALTLCCSKGRLFPESEVYEWKALFRRKRMSSDDTREKQEDSYDERRREKAMRWLMISRRRDKVWGEVIIDLENDWTQSTNIARSPRDRQCQEEKDWRLRI